MALSVAYSMYCDLCGADTGASKPTLPELFDHVRYDGWLNQSYGVWICGECYDPETIYHAQWWNVHCVLCQSGEHVPVIAQKHG